MPIKTYKDLNVFRESYGLALEISRVTRKFPAQEQFELARQLRRAARSIPANIVEAGKARSRGGIQEILANCDRLERRMQVVAGNEP